jgi:hypothetical protein
MNQVQSFAWARSKVHHNIAFLDEGHLNSMRSVAYLNGARLERSLNG